MIGYWLLPKGTRAQAPKGTSTQGHERQYDDDKTIHVGPESCGRVV
jgi:hypothetical protein